MTDIQTQHEALITGAALAAFPERTQLQLTGTDRARFFNNYCTADVMRLQPGSGTETFITNVKGKVIGHGFVFVGENALEYETVPGQAEMLIAHLDRYLFAEDVELFDRSPLATEMIVSGRDVDALLAKVTDGELPLEAYAHGEVTIDGRSASVRRIPFTGTHCFAISTDNANSEAVKATLFDAGCMPCQPQALEIARVEAGFPLFGRDITDEQLPQEVDRNEQAISFTKGCYLGQETVARLDALGHVNRTLIGVKFTGDDVPENGAELKDTDGKKIGTVTSAVQSVKLGCPLALAYVRTEAQQPGAKFSSEYGEAEKVDLPL